MYNQISVVIADDNTVLCSVLSDYLTQCGGIVVKGIANDGIKAVNMIRELSPDVVILDMIMPSLDGIGVLEKVSEMEFRKKPAFIMISAIGKDFFVRKSMELGADYYILKPFDMDMLVSRIKHQYNKKTQIVKNEVEQVDTDNKEICVDKAAPLSKQSLELIITSYIKEIGIPPNVNGYYYLREAVILSLECKQYKQLCYPVTKKIYGIIASRHNTTNKNVYRGIRCAINNAYLKKKKSGTGYANAIFGYFKPKKPSNVQLIKLLAEKALSELN